MWNFTATHRQETRFLDIFFQQSNWKEILYLSEANFYQLDLRRNVGKERLGWILINFFRSKRRNAIRALARKRSAADYLKKRDFRRGIILYIPSIREREREKSDSWTNHWIITRGICNSESWISGSHSDSSSRKTSMPRKSRFHVYTWRIRERESPTIWISMTDLPTNFRSQSFLGETKSSFLKF